MRRLAARRPNLRRLEGFANCALRVLVWLESSGRLFDGAVEEGESQTPPPDTSAGLPRSPLFRRGTGDSVRRVVVRSSVLYQIQAVCG
ncbi:hypothetical protein COEREDRAFT_81056 [Coemansia reversa NRRL 1564]|uniref:Uncharacterized protein n=1 Tax=Coemansia reversa (strain ATCC 12441 / NRRL 1564) TaxID=763665 RepID=A0A2G5BCG8_COERN|nr:hypothetical protein COEREDRAFT_81056 [Coemansia reversa NRRL 1564]|eukprot:PIA16691.1 hypothetical protein COEREDRAFT_81056 [Coemansia reversa NRRL 1564]